MQTRVCLNVIIALVRGEEEGGEGRGGEKREGEGGQEGGGRGGKQTEREGGRTHYCMPMMHYNGGRGERRGFLE